MSNLSADVLGAWARQATFEATSKGLDDDTTPVWQMDLKSYTLGQQSEALRRDREQLERVAARLRAVTTTWQPGGAQTLKSQHSSPEDDLRLALEQINGAQTKTLFNRDTTAQAELSGFVADVQAVLAPLSRIDTGAGGLPLASTVISWTGDIQTVWHAAVTTRQIALHRANVRIALARRMLAVRLLDTIATSAATIIIRLVTPGAQLLVFPALWQFTRDVLTELRDRQSAPV